MRLPRGCGRAYRLLRRDVLRWQETSVRGADVVFRAAEFVKAMEKVSRPLRRKPARRRGSK